MIHSNSTGHPSCGAPSEAFRKLSSSTTWLARASGEAASATGAASTSAGKALSLAAASAQQPVMAHAHLPLAFNNSSSYGNFEEAFELHEHATKESLLLRADTAVKTRYWLHLLRYHAKDLGAWRERRTALANIMMVSQRQSRN